MPKIGLTKEEIAERQESERINNARLREDVLIAIERLAVAKEAVARSDAHLRLLARAAEQVQKGE